MGNFENIFGDYFNAYKTTAVYKDNSKMEIMIVRNNEDLKFQTTINNLSDKMLHGYSADYAAHEILEKFKRFILNRYFIKEGAH